MLMAWDMLNYIEMAINYTIIIMGGLDIPEIDIL